jgi:hypothetical protein
MIDFEFRIPDGGLSILDRSDQRSGIRHPDSTIPGTTPMYQVATAPAKPARAAPAAAAVRVGRSPGPMLRSGEIGTIDAS